MKKDWIRKMALVLSGVLTIAGCAAATAAEDAEEPAENNSTVTREYKIPDTESYRFLQDMKIGWNLGNTFDAMDCNWLKNDLDYESGWCGVKTTPELIAAVKEAGFQTVRIPVSWHNHLSDEENYIVKEEWMARVNEVVDYCIDQDMYVILNIHHDNSEKYMYPDKEHLDQSLKYVTSIWSQIAERFQGYDDKLLFESLNEPRLVGHKNEWWIDRNSQDCRDAIACINQLNQAVVDTVRATGGNNATRYMICPGYDASPDGATNSGFVLPTDIEGNDGRIIVEVHAYTPYNFALESPGTDTWSSSNGGDLKNMTGFMDQIYYNLVSKEIPVIIDEFGAMEKNGNLEARVDFSRTYIEQARARGITCVWWDNGAATGNGERFGIIDRDKKEWIFPEIVEAMMSVAE